MLRRFMVLVCLAAFLAPAWGASDVVISKRRLFTDTSKSVHAEYTVRNYGDRPYSARISIEVTTSRGVHARGSLDLGVVAPGEEKMGRYSTGLVAKNDFDGSLESFTVTKWGWNGTTDQITDVQYYVKADLAAYPAGEPVPQASATAGPAAASRPAASPATVRVQSLRVQADAGGPVGVAVKVKNFGAGPGAVLVTCRVLDGKTVVFEGSEKVKVLQPGAGSEVLFATPVVADAALDEKATTFQAGGKTLKVELTLQER